MPAKKRDDGGKLRQRSDSFQLYLCFTKGPKTNTAHHDRMMCNLHAFTDKWSVLNEPIEKLHDAEAWPLLK